MTENKTVGEFHNLRNFSFTNAKLSLAGLILVLIFQTNCQTQTDLPKTNNKSLSSKETVDFNNSPPLEIFSVTHELTETTEQRYYFNLEFKKQRNDYKWLLTKCCINKPLNPSGTFDYEDRGLTLPFEVFEYSEPSQPGKLVVIDYINRDNFLAIRLPQLGFIKFEDYKLISFSEVSNLEVWEVKDLLINGKIPLEDWFPFDITSVAMEGILNEKDFIPKNLNDEYAEKRFNNLRSNSNQPIRDYPKEEIKFIKAEGIRKWNITFSATPDKKH